MGFLSLFLSKFLSLSLSLSPLKISILEKVFFYQKKVFLNKEKLCVGGWERIKLCRKDKCDTWEGWGMKKVCLFKQKFYIYKILEKGCVCVCVGEGFLFWCTRWRNWCVEGFILLYMSGRNWCVCVSVCACVCALMSIQMDISKCYIYLVSEILKNFFIYIYN